MRKIIIASLFLSSAAFAQAPPMPPPSLEPMPITLDVRMQEQIKTLLNEAPHKYARPIIDLIDALQRDTQARALSSKVTPPK